VLIRFTQPRLELVCVVFIIAGYSVDQSSDSRGPNTRERLEHNCGLIGSDERRTLRSSGRDREDRIRREIGEARARYFDFRNDALRASDDGMPGETEALRAELELVLQELLNWLANQAGNAIRQFADYVLVCQRRIRAHAQLLRNYTAVVIREIRELLTSADLFVSEIAVPWLLDPLVQRVIRTCEQILAEHADTTDHWDSEAMSHSDSRTWPPIVQQWEEFRAFEEIEPKGDNRIEESALRKFVSALSGCSPADVTWGQLRDAAGALCPHYGSAVLTPSVSCPQPEMIRPVVGADFWKEREDEFRKHDVGKNRALQVLWHSADNQWELQMPSNTDSSVLESKRVFTSLARQAGKGLSGPHRDDLFLRWLDALKQNGWGKDSIRGHSTILESRAKALRISDELVPPGCHLRFNLSPGPNGSGPTWETGESGNVNTFHAEFFEEFTSYLIEDVFRASANFCLELKSLSPEGPDLPVIEAIQVTPEPTKPGIPQLSARDMRAVSLRWPILVDECQLSGDAILRYASARLESRAQALVNPLHMNPESLYFETFMKLYLRARMECGVTQSVKLTEQWFSCLATTYLEHWSPQEGFEQFAAWLETIKGRVLADVASIWGKSDATRLWYQTVCEASVSAAVSAQVGTFTRRACLAESVVLARGDLADSDGLGEGGDNLGTPDWTSIQISFLSDERVQIFNGSKKETLNYSELGFADGRTGKPNQAWVILRALAEAGGTIRDTAKVGGDWPKVERRIQEIRKLLREHFNIAADPIPFLQGTGYKACFEIGCSPSFHT
jgi:hypothetical protein